MSPFFWIRDYSFSRNPKIAGIIGYTKKVIYRRNSIALLSVINCKGKANIQKTLTDTNASLKNFCMQKEISFIDNSGIKEIHLSKRKLYLNKKGNSAFETNLLHHINRTGWSFFPYGLVAVNYYIPDTLEKGKSSMNSAWKL